MSKLGDLPLFSLNFAPERRRSYYRALKRKMPDAIKFSKQGMFAQCLFWHITPQIIKEEFERPNFTMIDLISKDSSSWGGYLIMPFYNSSKRKRAMHRKGSK